MPERKLTDQEALVLALFRYGLALTPEDVAQHLHADIGEIVRVCHSLALAGLLYGLGS